MLTVSLLRANYEAVLVSLKKRNYTEFSIIDKALTIDDRRKQIQGQLDALLTESNKIAKEIGGLMKTDPTAAESKKAAATQLREQSAILKKEMDEVEEELEKILLQIPNKLSELVPYGSSAEDNEVYKMGELPIPVLYDGAIPHWELMKKYDIIDLELGAKITGAGFPVYKGKGAKLQRALISFFLDRAIEAGYTEIMPPLMVNAASARGTGQLPDKDGQMYHATTDDLYLIPTAEVPITNLYRDVTLNEEDFPIKMAGYTPCFRREAGAYGAHVRGLNRLHQFEKVEIVCLEHPDNSYNRLMEMLKHVESLLIGLELPYRILRLCGGDIGFASAMTFDFEVYSAAQGRWLEVSSVSNFETFQSARMQLKYRTKEKKTALAHTLNGSALALARIVASILENHQTAEGVRIPKALQAYTGFEFLTPAK